MHIPEGVIVAMVTPFDKEGKVNESQVRKFVNVLIDKKVDGLFPVASVGEYVHMDMSERKYLIDIVADEANGRIDIIPGTCATCYQQSIELANYAKDKGCAAIVLSGPYFFKNSEDVVEGHLKKVAESVDIPIFIYNIPFFANEVTPSMAERLCHMPNVIGIKDSSGNMINVMNLIEMTKKINPNFKVLVGAEEIMLPALLMGARGSMTSLSGILPEFMTGIWKAFEDGNFNIAHNLQMAVLPLIRKMKSFNFPQGFKEALDTRGIEMGPPKMSYPSEQLEKLADLKGKLRIEIQNLLDLYFPDTPMVYKTSEKQEKFSYPSIPTQSSGKKYPDCNQCGMCLGDRCNESDPKPLNGQNSLTINDNSQIARGDIERIVADIVKKVINEVR
ncbi:MAG: dihydrodipicolinate synthase family protein [Bacteroidota bacterium]